jgi:tRNA A-37 threonylcarbamoyl transferase component Bud32
MSGAAADSSPRGEYYCPICEQAFPLAGACPTDGTKLIHLDGGVDPFLGRDLDDKYTILEKLGQGGMGAVYRAEQRGLDRQVAIKVINAHRVAEPDVIKRFLREAKLASRLSHPNAVAVIDFGQTDDGVCYFVMELVTGRTLADVFAAEGVFPPERLVRIAAQICDALERAHALQIVHRDLKPSNAMLLDQGRDFVKILDFGLAKSLASGDATAMTITGALLGTPAYMSPELALGQPCDGRTDLYSLGVMLYLLGSGRLPFQSTSPHELISLHGTEPAPKMTGIPRALARVIDRLLCKDPADRYPTAAAVREALERALVDRDAATAATAAGAASAVEPGSLGSRAPRVGRARRWLGPAAALAGIAGIAGYLVLASDSPPPPASSPRPSPATVTSTPPDAAPPVPSDAAPQIATPLDAGVVPPAKPARPAKPTRAAKPAKPTRTVPKPARPVAPPEARPQGSGAANRDELPF